MSLILNKHGTIWRYCRFHSIVKEVDIVAQNSCMLKILTITAKILAGIVGTYRFVEHTPHNWLAIKT